MLQENLIRTALEAGATKATIIDQSQIVLSESFRKICESNQCGGYGKCWVCPPYLGEAGVLMAEVRTYPRGLWYQYIAPIEDSYDIEGMFEAGAAHARVSQRLQAAVKPQFAKPFLHLSCGGCHLCPTCAKITDESCRMPDKALASLEGYCIDVYNTTKSTDLKYINGQNTVTYFGIVLFSE